MKKSQLLKSGILFLIYTCTETDFQKAMQRIYFDKKNSSNIKVNVLK